MNSFYRIESNKKDLITRKSGRREARLSARIVAIKKNKKKKTITDDWPKCPGSNQSINN